MANLTVDINVPGRPGEALLREALRKTAILVLLDMDVLLYARNQRQVYRLEKLCDAHDCAWLKEYIVT